MTLEEYKSQFNYNLKMMSRTANGNLDVSASETKKESMIVSDADMAKNLALSNTDRALSFLYENRGNIFDSEKDLEEFILQIAKITNENIVAPDKLFRNGQDSDKYKYAKIKDLDTIWKWFIKTLHWMGNNECFEAIEVAAFCEYIINVAAHFFSDGCGKISMLMSTYVFIHEDLPCVKYVSRDEYYDIVSKRDIFTPENMKRVFSSNSFINFQEYYKSIWPLNEDTFTIYTSSDKDDNCIFTIKGNVTKDNCITLEDRIDSVYAESPDTHIIFECKNLRAICARGMEIFVELHNKKSFSFRNANHDMSAACFMYQLDDHIENGRTLKHYDITGLTPLGGGANATVYKINEETAIKVFTRTPSFEDLIRERLSTKNALVAGIPAPISLGYAEVDGKIAILIELLKSKSLMKRILNGAADIDTDVKEYTGIVKEIHAIRNPKTLALFPRDDFEKALLSKADKLDEFLEPEYKGLIRKVVREIHEDACLIHGDIQPSNVMYSDDQMIFIDYDTMCTGKAVYDLGALYRTVVMEVIVNIPAHGIDENIFLNCSGDMCRRIWDTFIDEYYKGESQETKDQKLKVIKIIGCTFFTAKAVKRNQTEDTKYSLEFLKEYLDQYFEKK